MPFAGKLELSATAIVASVISMSADRVVSDGKAKPVASVSVIELAPELTAPFNVVATTSFKLPPYNPAPQPIPGTAELVPTDISYLAVTVPPPVPELEAASPVSTLYCELLNTSVIFKFVLIADAATPLNVDAPEKVTKSPVLAP